LLCILAQLLTFLPAPSGALVVASIMQRTSDEETFYYMTAIANRRPLQVSIYSQTHLIRCMRLLVISDILMCSFEQVSPLATQAAFMVKDAAESNMKFFSASQSEAWFAADN
jgi:hypothetical protein